MEREKLRKILVEYGYKRDSVNKLLNNRQTPPPHKIMEMYEKYGIPFDAWKDIKSYAPKPKKPASSDNSIAS